MTAAFVEPYNAFDLDRIDPDNPPEAPWTIQPTNPELLEALAADFRESGYSIHHLMKTIFRSSAYQLDSRYPAEWKDDYLPYSAQIRPGAHRPGARGYDRTRDGTSGGVSVLRHNRYAGQTAGRAVRSGRPTRKR